MLGPATPFERIDYDVLDALAQNAAEGTSDQIAEKSQGSWKVQIGPTGTRKQSGMV